MTARSAPLNSSSTCGSREPFGRTRESTGGLSWLGSRAGTQAPKRPRRVECGEDRLASLVLGGVREPGAVERLLLSVTGEHAVSHRCVRVERHTGQSRGDGVADVLEV